MAGEFGPSRYQLAQSPHPRTHHQSYCLYYRPPSLPRGPLVGLEDLMSSWLHFEVA